MNEQILVIEDKNVAQTSIKPKLEQLGYNVLAIKSNEIKTVINSKKIKPNLILMHTTPDEKMSGINTNILDDFNSPIIHLADCSKNILKIRDSTDNVSYIAEPLEYNKLKSVIETTIYKHSQNSKENEEKYRLIFESSGIATAIIEENTTIHKVNTAFENFSGYLRDELEGKKLEKFILPHQVPEIERYYDLMRIDPESAPINYTFKFIDKFKDIKEVHSTAAMIQGTKRIIISILDISTERKLKKECTENLHSLSFDNRNMTSLNPQMVEMSELSKSEILNALLENEEYQKTILSTVQTGIVVIDAKTKIIIDINESALKFIGAQRDKVIGNICHKFICPADKGHCPIIDHNHVMDNSERTLLNINNEEIPIIKTVTPISLGGRKCLIESFMDITKLRLTENALRKSEAVLRSFFNSNDVIMSVIELVDDDIIYVLPNRRMAEFFGMNIKDLTGKHLTDLDVPTNFQNFLIKKIEECLKKGTINIEFNLSKNHERWYHGSISQINEKSSKKFSFVAIEITETKLMEDKLKASLKEKELLLHEIHHRVKNNLQIISSLLSLQSGYIKDDETLKIFKESQNRVMSLAMIHEKLYKSSNLVQIDFAEYVKDLVDKLFYTYKINQNNVQLSITIDNIFFDIETAIPCGLIINELITNSLKHAFPVTSGCRFENENLEKRSFLGPKIEAGKTESLQIKDLQHRKSTISESFAHSKSEILKDFEGSSIPVASGHGPSNRRFADPADYVRGPENGKFSDPTTTSRGFEGKKCTHLTGETDRLIYNPFNGDYTKNKINIELNEVGENFMLSIDDNGIGLPADFDFTNTTSLGLQLVTSLVDQLDGTITVDKTRGTTFKIAFKKMKYKKRL